jgi:hypothetical protein
VEPTRADRTVVVTTAGLSASDDRRARQRRYAQLQALRLVCFVLAVLLPVPLGVKLVLVGAALVLPWMGVVGANGGPKVVRGPRPTALVDRVEPTRIALEPGRDVDQA